MVAVSCRFSVVPQYYCLGCSLPSPFVRPTGVQIAAATTTAPRERAGTHIKVIQCANNVIYDAFDFPIFTFPHWTTMNVRTKSEERERKKNARMHWLLAHRHRYAHNVAAPDAPSAIRHSIPMVLRCRLLLTIIRGIASSIRRVMCTRPLFRSRTHSSGRTHWESIVSLPSRVRVYRFWVRAAHSAWRSHLVPTMWCDAMRDAQ